jgi:hypothetical protein
MQVSGLSMDSRGKILGVVQSALHCLRAGYSKVIAILGIAHHDLISTDLYVNCHFHERSCLTFCLALTLFQGR